MRQASNHHVHWNLASSLQIIPRYLVRPRDSLVSARLIQHGPQASRQSLPVRLASQHHSPLRAPPGLLSHQSNQVTVQVCPLSRQTSLRSILRRHLSHLTSLLRAPLRLVCRPRCLRCCPVHQHNRHLSNLIDHRPLPSHLASRVRALP